jgi:hypothetical protein
LQHCGKISRKETGKEKGKKRREWCDDLQKEDKTKIAFICPYKSIQSIPQFSSSVPTSD